MLVIGSLDCYVSFDNKIKNDKNINVILWKERKLVENCGVMPLVFLFHGKNSLGGC